MQKLSCHCKGVAAEINLDKLVKFIRCNCSICKRKESAIMSMVKNEDFKIIKGKDLLVFINSKLMLPVITFAPSVEFIRIIIQKINPAMTAFNVGCLDGIDTFKIKDVVLADGQNHPLDKK